MTQHIHIVGAGLAGSLMAIFLAKRGIQVTLYEKREDMRKIKLPAGRSINLALSNRGIRALKLAGLEQQLLKNAIPMYGRMLHSLDSKLTLVPYGKNKTEYINSISRPGLNMVLLDACENYPQIKIHFNEELEAIDLDTQTMQFRNTQTQEVQQVTAELIIATDGAGSPVRQAMVRKPGFYEEVDFLDYGYKELSLPASAGGAFQMEKNALHIWPRGTFMLIALPNLDGCFTCTLFLSKLGYPSFASLVKDLDVLQFFESQFPDVVEKMPEILEEYLINPMGLLGTVKCYPWHYKGKVLLLGDAAHAIVPFYGQGMNAAFEDCLVLDECIGKYGDNWDKIFNEYQHLRKENTDAIAELAIENFYEMRDKGADRDFLMKRKLELLLENRYEDYHSKYSMVTFHPEIPYSEAHRRGNLQDDFLLKLCAGIQSEQEVSLEEVYRQLQQLTQTQV